MTRRSDIIGDIIRVEERAGRLRSWSQDVRPGFFDIEMVYADEKDAHAVAGTLAGMDIRLDSVNTHVDYPGGARETKITFRVPTSGRIREADACPACKGSGHINLATCWHCDGEGTDPAP